MKPTILQYIFFFLKTRFGSQKGKRSGDAWPNRWRARASGSSKSSLLLIWNPAGRPPEMEGHGSSGGDAVGVKQERISEGGALPSVMAQPTKVAGVFPGDRVGETRMPEAVKSEVTGKLFTLLDPKIILSKASHRKTSMWYHLHVEALKMVPMNLFTNRLTDTENKGKDGGEG